MHGLFQENRGQPAEFMEVDRTNNSGRQEKNFAECCPARVLLEIPSDQHRDGKESQSEFDDFYASVHKYYEPVGWLEELWVEKTAVWSWRLRRLIRCESGQIDRALAGHSYKLQQSKADNLAEPDSPPSSSLELDTSTDYLFLPEKEELDKLLRYEATINRQLNHAMGELERVQTRRNGEQPKA